MNQFRGYQTVERAFKIVELLASDGPLGVTDLATRIDMEKSGVSRMLKTLCRMGYAQQTAVRGQYQLGHRFLHIGQRYLSGDRLLREAQPVLRELSAKARASAHLAQAVRNRFVLISKVSSPERIQVASATGAPVAPHASALGKVLLAYMKESERALYLETPLPVFTDKTITSREELRNSLKLVRKRGYALEEGEECEGVGCVGAPILDSDGKCVAAISASGPLKGTHFALDDTHIKQVVEAAESISISLGYQAEKTAV